MCFFALRLEDRPAQARQEIGLVGGVEFAKELVILAKGRTFDFVMSTVSEKLQGAELGDEIFHGEAACGRICGNQAGLEQGSHAEGFHLPVRGSDSLRS